MTRPSGATRGSTQGIVPRRPGASTAGRSRAAGRVAAELELETRIDHERRPAQAERERGRLEITLYLGPAQLDQPRRGRAIGVGADGESRVAWLRRPPVQDDRIRGQGDRDRRPPDVLDPIDGGGPYRAALHVDAARDANLVDAVVGDHGDPGLRQRERGGDRVEAARGYGHGADG